MEAQIFSIGTEILLGNITDTNSQYIAQRLMEAGINVYKMVTIGDNFDRLYKVLKECDGKLEYVICSGGLGPTADDISKEVAIKVCELDNEVEVHQESYDMLIKFFNGNKEVADKNIKQARFPKSAIVINNPKGTAPGCILESKQGTKYVLMPGPPNEMTYMLDNEVMKHLHSGSKIKSIDAKIALHGEWEMASKIDLDRSNPTISPYITDEGPVLRVTAKGETEEDINKQLEVGIKLVHEALDPYVVTTDNISKEEVLINLLKINNELVATAESITGGMIASSIIDVPGASEVIKESYIVYSDEAKEKLLNVSRETIKEYTVVSEKVLVEMLDGLKNLSAADLCIATTGYAHTGEVYVGILYKNTKYIRHLQLNGDRNRVRFRTKNQLIDMAILIMRGEYESNIRI